MNPASELIERLARYASSRGRSLKRPLGHGKDGSVYLTSGPTALKAFVRPADFARELAVYERLAYERVHDVLGHTVPRLLNHDASFLLIEMSVVERPFLLDFAGACLDWPPPFPAEVLAEREQTWSEVFGENWPHARRIVDFLANRYDIYLTDIHPGNIGFETGAEE